MMDPRRRCVRRLSAFDVTDALRADVPTIATAPGHAISDSKTGAGAKPGRTGHRQSNSARKPRHAGLGWLGVRRVPVPAAVADDGRPPAARFAVQLRRRWPGEPRAPRRRSELGRRARRAGHPAGNGPVSG